MSSVEESDDDFQSADEDIDFEPTNKKPIELKNSDSDQIQLNISKYLIIFWFNLLKTIDFFQIKITKRAIF